MKLLLLLINLLLVAADNRQVSRQDVEFKPQSSYHYQFSSKLLTGIPDLTNQYSGHEFKSKVIFHAVDANTVVMEMSDVELGQLHKTTSELPEETEMTEWRKTQLEEHFSKPIKFNYQGGKVESFESERNETPWSLNIKKSLLTLFNLDLVPENIIQSERNSNSKSQSSDNSKATYYGVYEDGVNGICETVYEIRPSPDPRNLANQDQSFILNVTKVRNYDNCLVDATTTKDNVESKGCPRACRKTKDSDSVTGYYPVPDEVENFFDSECPFGYEPTTTPTDQYTNYRYNVSKRGSNWVIDEATSEGKVTLNANGIKIVAITKQNAALIKIVDNDKIPDHSKSNEQHSRLVFTPDFSKDTDIFYISLVTARDQNELANSASQLLESVSKDISSGDVFETQKTLFKVNQMVDILSSMNRETLMKFFKEQAENGKLNQASDEDKVKRQLILDALPLSGSIAAAQVIHDLIENSDVQDKEAKQMLETLPPNMQLPTRDVLQLYQQMFEKRKSKVQKNSRKEASLKNALALALARMVNKACIRYDQNLAYIFNHQNTSKNNKNSVAFMIMNQADPKKSNQDESHDISHFNKKFHEVVCKSADLEKYVKWFTERFETSYDLQTKVESAKALSYLGARQALTVMEPYVSGQAERCPGYKTQNESQREEDCLFVRNSVINGLHHLTRLYPKQIRAMLMPVYKDRSENEEVRMNALTVIMQTNPKAHELVSIASDLRTENNHQVRSLTHSLLKNAAHLTEPCHTNLAQAARKALNFIPEYDEENKNAYSQAKWKDYYDDESQNGAAFYWQVTKSGESAVPSSGYLRFEKTFGTMKDNVFTLSFDQQGLEKYLTSSGGVKELTKNYIKSILENDNQSRPRRSSEDKRRNQDISEIKNRLKISTRESASPKLRLFTKMFERSAFHAWNEEDMRQFFDILHEKLSQNVQNLAKGSHGHYVRLYSPSSYDKVVISDNGMPILTQIRNPIIVSLKVENAKLNVLNHKNSKNQIPSFEFSAKIQPQVIKARWVNLASIDEANNQAYGSFLKEQTHINLPLEVTANFESDENNFKIKILPTMNKELLHHKTEAKTYIAKEKLSSGLKLLDKLDKKPIRTMDSPFKIEKQIGTERLGLGLHVTVTTENERYGRRFYETTTKSKRAAAIEALFSPDPRYKEVLVKITEDNNSPATGYEISLRLNHVVNQQKIETSNSFSGRNRANNNNKSQRQNFYSINANEQCNGNAGRHYPTVAKEATDSSNDEDLKKYAQRLLENTKTSWSWTYYSDKNNNEIDLATSICNLAITANSISSKPIRFVANIMKVQSVDRRVNLLKAEASVKRPQESNDSQSNYYWLVTSITYPSTINEFDFDSTSAQDMTSTIDANFGIGERCNQNKGVNVQGVMEKVKDQVYNQQKQKGKSDNKLWFEKQCEEDRANGNKGSYACEKAATEFTALNKYTLDIEYENVSPKLVNLTTKLDQALKAKFYHRMDLNGVNVNNPENRIRVEAEFSKKGKGRPVANLRIEKPKEEVFFERIDTMISHPPSALRSQHERCNEAAKCTWSGQTIRTFDNVTYQMSENNCQYVMSMDCSENEQFAVLVNSKKSSKNVTIMVENKKIEVYSVHNENAQLSVDEKKEQVTEKKPRLYCEDSKCLKIYLQESESNSASSTLVIESDKTDVKVTTDGSNIKVKLGPQYTGKVCGVCGNNDRETEKEFEGPERCIFETAEEFAQSYSVDDSCRANSKNVSRQCQDSRLIHS